MGKPIAQSLKQEMLNLNLHIIDSNIDYDLKNRKYNNIKQLIELAKPDVVLFALKPQKIRDVIAEYQEFIGCNTKIISIMAGVTIDYLQNIFPKNQVIRLMPNLGAKIQKSVNLAYATYISQQDQKFFTNLFNSFGTTIWLDHEKMLHAATAVAGSGPAYYYYILSIYTNYLIEAGFSQIEAKKIATLTAKSAIETSNNDSFSSLIEQVTSKGGTTEAALNILKRNNQLQKIITSSLDEAVNRSKELSS